MHSPKLILASTSQTRRRILKNAGLTFDNSPPKLDEEAAKNLLSDLSPQEIALSLASQKALSLSEGPILILGADQTLSCQGQLFNKPRSLSEAEQQLKSLRGQHHILHSALSIAQNGQTIWTVCEDATLTMRQFSDAFAKSYIETCGAGLLNTVGGYQLEGVGAQLFEKIDGDYFTILGLPLLPCLAFLRSIKFITS
jgi:septum formation protein